MEEIKKSYSTLIHRRSFKPVSLHLPPIDTYDNEQKKIKMAEEYVSTYLIRNDHRIVDMDVYITHY